MKKGWVNVCPKCESREVTAAANSSPNYVCLTCGFQGVFTEISKEEAKKLPNKPIKFKPSGLPILANKYKENHKWPVIFGLAIITFLLVLLILFA